MTSPRFVFTGLALACFLGAAAGSGPGNAASLYRLRFLVQNNQTILMHPGVSEFPVILAGNVTDYGDPDHPKPVAKVQITVSLPPGISVSSNVLDSSAFNSLRRYWTYTDQTGFSIPANTLGATLPGTYTLSVSALSLADNSPAGTASVTLVAIADNLTIPGKSSMEASVSHATATFGPISVSDAWAGGGGARSGQPVKFVCSAPAGAACPPSSNVTIVTDTNGTATLTGFSPGRPGAYKITASAVSGSPVAFSLDVPTLCTHKAITEHEC